MCVCSIDSLSEKIAKERCDLFLKKELHFEVTYDSDGRLNTNDNIKEAYNHKGLYAFILAKDNNYGIVYVGKSENSGRLRQHLTGKNKNDSQLAVSTKTKHAQIKNAIRDNYRVYLAMAKNSHFKKSTLSCLEIECISIGKSQLSSSLNIPSWNLRNS